MVYPAYVDADEIDRAFASIAQAVMRRKVEFLLGAGMSMDSNVPSGLDLAKRLLGLFFPDTGTDPPSPHRIDELARGVPFEALVEGVQLSMGRTRTELSEHLTSILIDGDYHISEAHRDLLSVCNWLGSPPVVSRLFTTNFDKLLDIAFDKQGKRITQKNTREIVEAQRNGRVPILYLHGTIEGGEYQITEDDIFGDSFNTLHMAFRTALDEADAFVFVGYSMNDPDFRRLYRQYRADIQSRRKDEKLTYVVGPASDKYEYSLGRKIWASRGAIWLPFTAGGFFAHTKTVLATKGDNVIQKFIMEKYGLKTNDEYQAKLTSTSQILNVSESDAIRFLAEARTKTGKSS